MFNRKDVPQSSLKMGPLEQSYKVFVLLCICAPEWRTNRASQIARISFSIYALVSMIIANIGSIVFVFKYFTIDLSNSLFAIFQIAAVSEATYTYVTALVLRDKIQNIFSAIWDIHKLCNLQFESRIKWFNSSFHRHGHNH